MNDTHNTGTGRLYNGVARPQYTPEMIRSLKPDEIFVFGSNLGGHHGGGAARVAVNKFGAVWGQGVGHQGQCYAIPTMQGGVETIKPYVDQFVDFAKNHGELFFYVTRIGCGIAGFRDEDIAPLFRDAVSVENICLPKSFVDVFANTIKAPESYKVMMYGQCRTFADIVKSLNNNKRYHTYEELMPDFLKVIKEYQKRGTANKDLLVILENVLRENEKDLFSGESFHFERFAQKLDSLFDNRDTSKIDVIFTNRQMTKLLILLKTLNDICRYTDIDLLRNDLLAIASGRYNCGDNSYMGDPLDGWNYPINWFLHGLQEQWNNIVANGVLDNQLLEKVMFTNHMTRVQNMGLNAVIYNDFEIDGPCHPEVFFPKEIGTAPVYVEDEISRRYVKACGEGKGPRRGFGLYEMTLVMPVLMREVRNGNYILLDDNFFLPVGTLKKPVFIQHLGRVRFASIKEKQEFIDRIKREHRR